MLSQGPTLKWLPSEGTWGSRGAKWLGQVVLHGLLCCPNEIHNYNRRSFDMKSIEIPFKVRLPETHSWLQFSAFIIAFIILKSATARSPSHHSGPDFGLMVIRELPVTISFGRKRRSTSRISIQWQTRATIENRIWGKMAFGCSRHEQAFRSPSAEDWWGSGLASSLLSKLQ